MIMCVCVCVFCYPIHTPYLCRQASPNIDKFLPMATAASISTSGRQHVDLPNPSMVTP